MAPKPYRTADKPKINERISDARWSRAKLIPLPVVAVAGHRKIPEVTNVVLDHWRAAELTPRHLHQSGHAQIVFMRGQSFSSDSDARWQSLVAVARELGIEIHPELTIQLEKDLFCRLPLALWPRWRCSRPRAPQFDWYYNEGCGYSLLGECTLMSRLSQE